MQFIYGQGTESEKSPMHGIDSHPEGKLLEIPQGVSIRGVQLRHSGPWCKGLKFLDGNDNVIVDHTWMGQGDMGKWGPIRRIPEGQSIIGFSAFKHTNCALAFGLILGASP